MDYAIILAAGKGSRMESDIPKCCHPILGKPMICYLIEQIKNTSIDNILCVVGYKKEYLFQLLGDSVSYRLQKEQYGSGDAVKSCKGIEEDGFCLILNGDVPFVDQRILQEMINQHLYEKNVVTLATTVKQNPFGYGRIIRNEQGKILKITEEIDLDQKEKQIQEVNCGILIVQTTQLFNALEKLKCNHRKNEYYLTDLIEILSGEKINNYAVLDENKVRGVNTLYELLEAEEYIRLEIIKKKLEEGVKIEGINDTIIGPDVIIEKGALISHSKVLGNSIIHKNAEILDSDLDNAIIFDDTMIWHSVVKDSLVGKSCTVGPFAHIRGNSLVCGKNRIGNFVEIKNSKIGIETKLSHLAYMGDTLCGRNVNFGCGSITVNYDGKKKNKTIIGNHVFVGCNTNLIAPITIDSNSYVAAGSTITEDMEAGDFAIARSFQVTKKGYASKYDREDSF